MQQMKALTLKNASKDLNQIFAKLNPFLTAKKTPSKNLHRIKNGNHSRTLSVGRDKSVNSNNMNESKDLLFLNSKNDHQSANANNEEFINFENNFEILQNESFIELKNISPDESFKEKPEFKILTGSEKEKRNFSNGEEILRKLEEHICKNEILKHKIKDLTEKYIIDLSKKEKEINELKGYRDYYLNLNKKYELITKKKKNELFQEKDHLFIENLQKENNLLKIENLRINEENRVINKKIQFTEKQFLANKENIESLKKEKDEFIKKMKYLIIKLKNVEKENGFLQKKQSENKTLINSLQNEISNHIDTITQLAQQNRKIEQKDDIKSVEEEESPEIISQKLPKKSLSNKHSSFTINKGSEKNFSPIKRISLDHNKKNDSNFVLAKESLKSELEKMLSPEINNEEVNLKNSSEKIQKDLNEIENIGKDHTEVREKEIKIDKDKKTTSNKSIGSKKSSIILNNFENHQDLKIEKNDDINKNENISVHNSRNSIILQKKKTLLDQNSKNEITIDNIENRVENKNMLREESLKQEILKSDESIKLAKRNSQFSVRSLRNSKNLEKILTPTLKKDNEDIISNLISNSNNIERDKQQHDNPNISQHLEKRLSSKSIQSIRSQKSRENTISKIFKNNIEKETQIEDNLTLNEKAKTYEDMVIIHNDNKFEEKEQIIENVKSPEKEQEDKTPEILNYAIIKEKENLDNQTHLKEKNLNNLENNLDYRNLYDTSYEQNIAYSYLKSMTKIAIENFFLQSEKKVQEEKNDLNLNEKVVEKKCLDDDFEKDAVVYIQFLIQNSLNTYNLHSVPLNKKNEENAFENVQKIQEKQNESVISEELVNSKFKEMEMNNSNTKHAEVADLEVNVNKNYKKKSIKDNAIDSLENKEITNNKEEKQKSIQKEEEKAKKIHNTNDQEKSENQNDNSQKITKENLEKANEKEISEFKCEKYLIENKLMETNENKIEESEVKDNFTKSEPEKSENNSERIVNDIIKNKHSIKSEKKLSLAHSEQKKSIELENNDQLKKLFEEKKEDFENEKEIQPKDFEQINKLESINSINNQSQIDEIKAQKISEGNLKEHGYVYPKQNSEKLKNNDKNEYEAKNLDQKLIAKNDQSQNDLNLEDQNRIEEKIRKSIEEKKDFDILPTTNEKIYQPVEVELSIEVDQHKNLSNKTTKIEQKITHSIDKMNNNMQNKFEEIVESSDLEIQNRDFLKKSIEENEEELDLKPENIESPRNEKISSSIEKQKKEKKELMSSNIKSKGKVNTRYDKGNESERIKTIRFLAISNVPHSKTVCKKICHEMDFNFINFEEGLTTEKILQDFKNDLFVAINQMPSFFLLEIVNNGNIDPLRCFNEFTYDYLFCIRSEDSSYGNAFEELEKFFTNENKIILKDLNEPEEFKNIIRGILEKMEK